MLEHMTGTVQSIERAFAVLRSLSSGPAGVTEIADQIELPKSTVSRLLGTLESIGVVEQVQVGGEYRIGAGMLDLAAAAQPVKSLVAAARPHLAELVRRTGEAAGVSIPDGLDMRYLDQVNPDGELQARDWTGTRIPMHAVPSGHVVLAASTQLQQTCFASNRIEFTPHTLTTTTALKRRLADVTRDGYAWANEEFAIGMSSVAAAIHDPTGKVIGALHVYGPSSRFPGDRDADQLGQLLHDTAARVRLT
jgi:IclR family transcriptional regulator, acetate operon repressor